MVQYSIANYVDIGDADDFFLLNRSEFDLHQGWKWLPKWLHSHLYLFDEIITELVRQRAPQLIAIFGLGINLKIMTQKKVWTTSSTNPKIMT